MSKSTIEFIDLSAQRRRIGSRIDSAIARVLDHGRFILGPEVEALEERLAAFAGVRHCITCANGTDALELALTAMNIGPCDGVVVPAFSFVATAEAVMRVGASPVFADVDEESFNLCPRSAGAAIVAARAQGVAVRCIMPVDLFGQAADHAAIRQLADTHGLRIVADAAQGFGAISPAGRVGSLADITATSFYPSKPLGCYGDGGALFTDDAALAALSRSLRSHGQAGTGGAFAPVGRNSRLDTIQAAILIEKLRVFEDEIAARDAVARRYSTNLAGTVGVPLIAAGNRSVWAQYTVKVAGARDEIAAACRTAGVPVAVHYATPLHRLPAFRHFPTASAILKRADALSACVLSLPMHADLDEETQDRVIEALHGAVTTLAPEPVHADD